MIMMITARAAFLPSHRERKREWSRSKSKRESDASIHRHARTTLHIIFRLCVGAAAAGVRGRLADDDGGGGERAGVAGEGGGGEKERRSVLASGMLNPIAVAEKQSHLQHSPLLRLRAIHLRGRLHLGVNFSRWVLLQKCNESFSRIGWYSKVNMESFFDK